MAFVDTFAFEETATTTPSGAEVDSRASLRGWLGLLPPGKMWPRHEGTNLFDFCHGMSLEGERIIQGTNQLLLARDPRNAFALLTDWEVLLGLPDCTDSAQTIAERQKAAYARLVNQGNYNPDELIKAGASLGYDINIRLPGTFFKWQLARHALATANMSFGAVWDRLYIFVNSGTNDAQLECEIERLAPAHMAVTFFYT